MAKYKPGKSGVPTRKIKEVKKKIKEVEKSPRDARDDQRYEELLMLLRKLERKPLAKPLSDVDRARMNSTPMGPMSEEERKRLFSKNPRYIPEAKRKGGGKVYTSQNKKYGGGIYPKRGK